MQPLLRSQGGIRTSEAHPTDCELQAVTGERRLGIGSESLGDATALPAGIIDRCACAWREKSDSTASIFPLTIY
jgi:hypothetical protein